MTEGQLREDRHTQKDVVRNMKKYLDSQREEIRLKDDKIQDLLKENEEMKQKATAVEGQAKAIWNEITQINTNGENMNLPRTGSSENLRTSHQANGSEAMDLELPANNAIQHNQVNPSQVNDRPSPYYNGRAAANFNRSYNGRARGNQIIIPWRGMIITPTHRYKGNLNKMLKEFGREPIGKERFFRRIIIPWRGQTLEPSPNQLLTAEGDLNRLSSMLGRHNSPRRNSFLNSDGQGKFRNSPFLWPKNLTLSLISPYEREEPLLPRKYTVL